ncbi:MAG: AraC family transcriptional regulator [Gammaproteobacteria bacterium]|nr:AraC family transcriptional regulator [Gammaproteobacteria bacterium]
MSKTKSVTARFLPRLDDLVLNGLTFRTLAAAADTEYEIIQPQYVFLYRVDSGEAWFSHPTLTECLHLVAGDIVLVMDGAPHSLRTTLHQPAGQVVPLRDLESLNQPRGLSPPSHTSLLVGSADLETRYGSRVAPPIVHVPITFEKQNPMIFAVAEIIALHVSNAESGSYGVLRRLSEVLSIEVARFSLARTNSPDTWLASYGDKPISKALDIIHADITCDWELATLAASVGLSRSVFAARFTKLIGTPPKKYVRELRLFHAARLLVENQHSVGQVAFEAGYLSEASFNRAFSKQFGVTPGKYQVKNTSGPSDIVSSIE